MLALSLDQLVAWGVLYYAYAVLSAPMARELGVSRRFVAGAFSCTLLVAALLAGPIGRLLDRAGARPVLLAGAVLGPATFGALAGVRQELPLLLVFALLGVAHAFSLYEPAFRAAVDWFPTASARSRALLAITSVGGLASTVFLPLTAALLERSGWRAAVLALAVVAAGVMIPLRLALPGTRAARDRVAEPRRQVEPGPPVAPRVLAALALQSLALTGATLSLVEQLVDRGEPLATAAGLAGLAGGSQVAGRWLVVALQRSVRAELRLPLLFLVPAAAIAGIAVGTGPVLAVAVILLGVAGGAMTLERAALALDGSGRTFGARSGQIASAVLLARAASPFVVEVLRGAGPTFAAGALSAGLVAGALLIGGAGRLLRVGIACGSGPISPPAPPPPAPPAPRGSAPPSPDRRRSRGRRTAPSAG